MIYIKSFNKFIGNYGEDLAVIFLEKKKHFILKRNFRYKKGEIDIISKTNNLLIFTEVKSRYSNSFGYPMESVTYFKQKQIIKLSFYYILKHNISNMNIRYDVIEIIFNHNNDNYFINHLEDAYRGY